MARGLGVEEYGIYAAAFALVSAVGPFSNLGAGHVMVRAIAHGHQPERAFCAGVTRIVVGALIFTGLTIALRFFYLDQVPVAPILLLAAAELLGTAINDLAASFYFGTGNARSAAIVRFQVTVLRLFSASLFLLVHAGPNSLIVWCALYMSAMLMAATGNLFRLRKSGIRLIRLSLREFVSGVPFSLNVTAAYVQDDIDKTLVLKYSGAEVAGFYAAGYRIINFAYIPLQAALNIIYPKFFKEASKSSEHAWRLSSKLLIPCAGYGLMSALGLVAASSVAPFVLGHEYASAKSVTLLLCWLPFARALNYDFADFCTSVGRQSFRISAQAAGGATNVALNIWLIPEFGWRGAVYSSALSETLTVGLLVLAAVAARRRPNFREVLS